VIVVAVVTDGSAATVPLVCSLSTVVSGADYGDRGEVVTVATVVTVVTW
jgi:hypothetical protein